MKRIIFSLNVFIIATCIINAITEDEPKARYQEKGSGVTGFYNITETDIAFGIADVEADFSRYFLGVSAMFGHGIFKNLDGAIGAGVSTYNGGTLFPIFLDVRFSHNFGKINSFLFGTGGVLLQSSDPDAGRRVFGNPGVGIRLPFGNNIDGNLSAGFFIQALGNKTHDSFVNIRIGLRYLFRRN